MSLQRDDQHVTVPHYHAADAGAVKAEEVKLKMRTHVRDIRACPGQVLAAGIALAAGEVRVKLGRTDSIRQKRGILPAEPAALSDIDISGN